MEGLQRELQGLSFLGRCCDGFTGRLVDRAWDIELVKALVIGNEEFDPKSKAPSQSWRPFFKS